VISMEQEWQDLEEAALAGTQALACAPQAFTINGDKATLQGPGAQVWRGGKRIAIGHNTCSGTLAAFFKDLGYGQKIRGRNFQRPWMATQ
jgi:hypothetical protein